LAAWIVTSIIAHVVVVGLYFVLTMNLVTRFEEPPVMRVHIVQKGKKRDETLLPRIVPEQPKIPEEIKHEEPAAPQPEAPKPEAPTKPEKHQLAPPEKTPEKKPPSGNKSLNEILKKHTKDVEKEGNPDGSEYGNSVIGDLKDSYEAVIEGLLKEHFVIPESISQRERQTLDVEINLRIDADGGLIRVKVVSPSNSSYYDNIVVARAKEIESYGAPPLMLRKSLKRDGLNVHMCPGTCPN